MSEKNKVVYGTRVFLEDDVKSGNLYRAVSPLPVQLEADTLTTVVKCEDPSILNTAENSKMLYFREERQAGVFYAQSIQREGPEFYKLSGASTMSLLASRLHSGGIYTGQTAETIIREIVGNLPFVMKGSIKDTKLYGWLPYAKPPERSARDNLVQVLFAVGATVKTDPDGTLRIVPLWNGISGCIQKDRIYQDCTVEYEKSPVTAVSVTEHQYMVGGDEKKLFEGEAQANDIITFNEPMYSLTATGFRILASGANFARVSSGTGTLTGRQYIHMTRQIVENIRSGPENVKSVSDATLVSLVNSKSVAQRMAAYYKCTERIRFPVLHGNEGPGDILLTYHPYDKDLVSACIETEDTSISNTLRTMVSALVDYKPPQISQVVTYDQHQLITTSGTVTLPDGVESVRVILISGGAGGTAGQKGSDGTAGSGSSSSSSAGSTTVHPSTGAAGKGGNGGGGGGGGAGGRVASFEIKGAAIKTITVNIGGGGAGGSSNGSAGSTGSDTTVTINGATYSSYAGSVTSSGYQDLVTGIVYATPGGSGNAGAKGGDGGAPTSSENYPGSSGASAGSNRGGPGGSGSYNGDGNKYTRSLGGGGGGGAAYNAPGGTGGSGSGSNGGAGGTGATGTRPSTPSRPGCGGPGGNGGGGGGGGGGTLTAAMNGGSTRANGGSAGPGGNGGPGGYGAPGCVILYYGVQEEVKAGALMDKNGKFILDRLGRLIVT